MSSLYERQSWFAQIISAHKFHKDQILPLGCERLEIYHQLYWNRLFNYFYRTFPFLTRLFGEEGINEEITIPYLISKRPKQNSLNLVGAGLLPWLSKQYHRSDRELVLDVAQLDWAHESLFLAPRHPFPKGEVSELLYLQPYVALFSFQGDLMELRHQFMKQSAAYWETHAFPTGGHKQPYWFLIYYSLEEGLVYQKICSRQYELLCSIKKGKSLEQIVKDSDPEIQNDLPQWIYAWAHQGLLSRQEVL